jgi:hypothetical protein
MHSASTQLKSWWSLRNCTDTFWQRESNVVRYGESIWMHYEAVGLLQHSIESILAQWWDCPQRLKEALISQQDFHLQSLPADTPCSELPEF